MRKSVLLLGNYPPPFGGVPTHINYLADYLAARSWDVHVVSYTGPQPGVERKTGYTVYRLVQRSRWEQILRPSIADAPHLWSQRRAFISSPRLAFSWVGTMHFVRDLVRRHDIRLVSAYHLLGAGVVGSWLVQELGTRLITTVFGEIYSQEALHRRHIDEVRQVLARSTRLLSCSRHCAESFRRLGLNPVVEAVHYGIDVARFRPGCGGEELRRRLGIPEDAPVGIYVARMVREMGLHVLLEAIPQVLCARSEAVFLIAGTRGELTPAAEALAAQHPGHVFVIPDVPFADLPAYYDACSFGVAPSISARACLGLAIAEAMAVEKPVIGADVGGTAEVIVPGETGVLVPPDDFSALAAAIVNMIADAPGRTQMGRLARERALSAFDKERTNERMEQIFAEALA